MNTLRRKFRLPQHCFSSRGVPHITLYGPFDTNNEHRMVSSIQSLCRRYERIYFSFRGFKYFNNPQNKVIYLDILPSEDFKKFRHSLATELRSITQTISKEDRKSQDDFIFHTTLAFKGIDNKFKEIWQYLDSIEKPNIRQTLLRLTILKNGKILYEYDFMQRKLLNRSQALNRQVFRRTIEILKQQPRPSKDSQTEIQTEIVPKQQMSWLDKIKALFRQIK
jgi:2'-5' RNA ligase